MGTAMVRYKIYLMCVLYGCLVLNCATCKSNDAVDVKKILANKISIQEELSRERHRRKEQIRKLEKEIITPAGVRKDIYIDYLSFFGPEWSDYRVTSEKTIKEFRKYFGTTQYRVIWHWDIDGCGYNDYLAVEVYPKVRRGIKKGIVVDEIGRVKLYLDTIKGVYTPEYTVLNLHKLGHTKNEVECYAIGYIPWTGIGRCPSIALGQKSLDGLRARNKKYPGHVYTIGGFELQRIDKNLKVMGTEYTDINASYRMTDMIMLEYSGITDKVFYSIFLGLFPLEKEYAEKRKYLNHYRIAKRHGKVFSTPTTLDPVHVGKAVQIMNLE